MDKVTAAKSAVPKLDIRLAVDLPSNGDDDPATDAETGPAIETDAGKKASHIEEPQSSASHPSLKARGSAQRNSTDTGDAESEKRRRNTDIALLRLLQENRQLRARLNHAERFIGQLHEQKAHVTAQRDWHSADRDRIAAILLKHEEAAVSQWENLCALSDELARSRESDVAKEGRRSEIQDARNGPADLLDSIGRELAAARDALANREAELKAIHRSRLWRLGQYYWNVLRIFRLAK